MLALALALLVTLACGGGEEAADGAPGHAATPSAAESTAASGEAAAPAASESAPGSSAPESAPTAAPDAAPATSSKPAPALTRLDGDGPISAGDLAAAYDHWKGEVITVAGYPALFMSPATWNARLNLGSVAEAKAPELVQCSFDPVPEGKVDSATPVVVRGTVKRRMMTVPSDAPPKIIMDGCELVSSGDMPPGGDAWNLGSGPIPVQALHDAMFGWQGQTVQVEGYYKGSTHSSATDVTRHDFRAGQSGDVVLECRQAGKVSAPDSMVADRAGVIVEGTIGEPGFKGVALDDCRIVNRG